MGDRDKGSAGGVGVTTVLVLTESDAFERAVGASLPKVGYRAMRAANVGRAVELAGAGFDVVVIDAAVGASFDVTAVKSLREEFAGFMIVCPGANGAALRSELASTLRAVECEDMSREKGELGAQIERLAAVKAHRRELEECEQGERDCTLRKPRLKRTFSGRRRMMLLIAAAVILLTAIAVPWVVVSLRRAKQSVESSVDVTNETINAIHRMEGYLQRDEERKIQRDK